MLCYTSVYMAKQKKKRSKKYSGSDAAQRHTTITRVSAVSRSRLGQWWFDHKRIVKPILITAAVVAAITLIIIQIIQLATSNSF